MDGYSENAIDSETASNDLMLTEALAINNAANTDGVEGFYRYSGRSLTKNANTLSGISSTQFFWSVSNLWISNYMRETEQLETMPQNHSGYDDRTALLSLSSVLYYALPSKDNAPLPYGFSYVDSYDVKSKYKIYRNDYALPLGYCYDSVINETMWNDHSSVEKQEAMLQTAFIEDYDGDLLNDKIELTSKSLDYSITCDSRDVTLEEYGFVVTKSNAEVTIDFDGLPNAETYFNIKGLDYNGVSKYDLYFGDEKYDPLNLYNQKNWDSLTYTNKESIRRNKIFWTEPTTAKLTLKTSGDVSKTITYYTEDYSWYNDRHDFAVNLDYSDDGVTSVTLKFSAIGIYSFDSIDIVCQPMKNYPQQISALKSYTLDSVEVGTDEVSGIINLDKSSVLCLSIPYSIGWNAYVDGTPTELHRANVKNMAIILERGEHEVHLVYHTPFLRLGLAISLVGFSLFAVLIIYKRKNMVSNINLYSK